MSIQQIESALLFDSNIYLIIGTGSAALIDTGTGFAVSSTIASVKKALNGRKLDYILLTHRHYDHVGGLGALIKEFSPTKVLAGHDDAEPLRIGDSESTLGTKFGGHIDPMDVADFNEGDVLDLGGHTLTPILTPGHTVGSISILDTATESLFSGDTLFVGSVGNTIHPTGSDRMLAESLKKLCDYNFTGLYPGHGPCVTKGAKEQLNKGLSLMGVLN